MTIGSSGRDRAEAELVADRGLRSVGDDEVVGRHPVVGERLANRGLHELAGERLAVDRQAAVRGLGAGEQISFAAPIPASAARCARRIPASSASVFTRRRSAKKS